MDFFYFLDKYFDKLNDLKFKVKWKNHFHDHLFRSIWIIFFLWVVIVVLCGTLLIELLGLWFGLIITIFLSGYFAYIMIFQFLRFIAKHNTRFIQGDMFNQTNTFKHDDVVETIKK